MVKRNTVAVTVAAILSAALRVSQAHAQQAEQGAKEESSDDLQEVVVTGLRASLQAAMDVKRDAIGVVDAISAEDIGKFPDANLSEALQRISGISISRRNGEGALVTARGFGAEYNMVTLNGRMMPAADAFGGGGNGFDGGVNGQNRSFNFANLASESISGIEVFKTGKAAIATGGIGATVNVLTARPLDTQGMVANFGVKGVKDTTNRVGNDINPELSGIFSYADADKRWGVGLTGSFQKRESGSSMATINDWNVRTWTSDLARSTTPFATGARIENAPAEGQLYAIPNDIRYHFSDRQRERKNGQLTVQFRPMQTMTLTADYTYAENELIEDRGDQTMWMNASGFSRVVFDTGKSVATPLLLEEDEGTRKDFGFEQQHREQTSKLKSPGLNIGWAVTDRFSLNFDIHDSQATSLPSDPVTGGGETQSTIAVRLPRICDVPPGDPENCTNRVLQTFHFNDRGLPLATRTVFPQRTTGVPATGGDPNFDFTTADLGSQYLRVNYQAQTTDITQARLDGELDFEVQGRFQFGVETRTMKSHQQASQGTMKGGDWSVASPGEVPSSLVQAFSLTNQFEDFDTTGTPIVGFKGDANALARWFVDRYQTWDGSLPPGVLAFNPNFNQDHVIEEDTDSVYLQYGLSRELGSLPANLLVGVRYERTDLEAVSQLILPTGLNWTDNNDFFRLSGRICRPRRNIESAATGFRAMARHEMLDNVTHKHLRVITRHGAQFGDNVGSVVTFPTEYGDVQREYPIFFRKDPGTGEYLSVALLGFQNDENLFLDEGGWQASYVPGVLARGPFLIGFQEQEVGGSVQKEPVIHVNMDDPRVSRTEGEPVFLPQGGNSHYLERIAAILKGALRPGGDGLHPIVLQRQNGRNLLWRGPDRRARVLQRRAHGAQCREPPRAAG